MVISGVDDELIVYASAASREVLGVEPGRLVGTRTVEWIHQDDVEQVRTSRASAVEGGEPYTVEVRLRHAERGWVWCESRITITDAPEATSRFVVSSARDISARRRTQQLLGTLHGVAVVANEASDAASVLDRTVTTVSESMGWPAGRVFVVDGDKLIESSSPIDPGTTTGDEPDRRSRLADEEFELAEDACRSARVRWSGGPEPDGSDGRTGGGAVAVPVVAEEQVAAVFVWRTAGQDASHRSDLTGTLRCLRGQVSVAIERLRSRERVEDAASELARFGVALAELEDLVLFTDPRTQEIVYVNRRVAHLAGVSRDGLIGRTPWQVWPDWDDSGARHVLESVAGGAGPVEFEVQLAAPKGRVDVAFVAQRVDEDVVLVGHDVTTRNEAAVVRARLASVVEHADVAVVVVEPSDEISSWNTAAEAMFGYAADEVSTMGWRRLFPINRHRQLHTVIDQVRGGTPVRLDTLARRSDGYPFDVSVSLAPVRTGAGPPHVVSLIVANVTEQRQALRLLETSEERFRNLAENAVEGIYQLQLEPRVHFDYVNPAMEVITGIPVDRFYANGDILGGWLSEEDAEQLTDARRNPNGDTWPIEVRWPIADGRHSWLSIREHPLGTSTETSRTVQGLVLDVTARHEHEQALQSAVDRERAARHELRRLDDLKTAFLQAVSHELRTPLTSVVGFAQTLRDHDERLPTPQRRQMLGRMAANAQKLGGLLQDLLDLDRLSRRVIEPQPKVFDLSALCRTVVEDIDRAGHQLHLPSDPVIVTADPSLLERIIDNLVRNSLRHTPPGTTVTVTVDRTPDGVELAVHDDGPGIPPDERDALFEPFHHGPDTRIAASPGLGIGLSLVRQFARLHDGDVRLDDAPTGARFVVSLPTTSKEATAPSQPADRQDDDRDQPQAAENDGERDVIPAAAWSHLAEIIDGRLSDLRLDRETLADRAGISTRTLDRLLNANPKPLRLRSLRKIAPVVDLPLTDIIELLAEHETDD